MQLPYRLNEGSDARRKLGLIVLKTDETIERDFRALRLPDDLWLYHSRIPSALEVTVETLSEMEQALPTAAGLFPTASTFDVIGYACTSGATVLGESRVEAMVQQAHPEARVTNPMTALKAACRALGITRLGMVSPYVEKVSDALRQRLEQAKVQVTSFGEFGEKEEWKVARIDRHSIIRAMVEVGSSDTCDAVFASCTNLRAFEAIEEVESLIDKPALCSNQVLAWHMLRLTGVADPIAGAGRLFSLA